MNFIKAAANRIMWWPVNQECADCLLNKRLSLADLQAQGIIPDLKKDEEGNCIPQDEEYLAYHASKCKLGLVLGALGTDSYECSYKQT